MSDLKFQPSVMSFLVVFCLGVDVMLNVKFLYDVTVRHFLMALLGGGMDVCVCVCGGGGGV